MRLGIPVYEGVNLLDVAGPLEMFYWAGLDKDLTTVLVSEDGRA
jgi:putative intracellular protease/amidase